MNALPAEEDVPAEAQWDVTGWVDSIDAVKDALASALLQPLVKDLASLGRAPSGKMQFTYMRSLADASAAEIEDLLSRGDVVRKLAAALMGSADGREPTGLHRLRKQEAATASDLHEKFAVSEGSFQLEFGSLSHL